MSRRDPAGGPPVMRRAVSWLRRAVSWLRRAVPWLRRAVPWLHRAVPWLRRSGRAAAAALGHLLVALAAILLVLATWPTDRVEVLGVQVELGAQRPGPGFGLHGPGELVSFGQSVDVRAVDVTGPVRPYIETTVPPYDLIRIATTDGGPQEAGEALTRAFGGWALRRSVAVVLVGGALVIVVMGLAVLAGRLPHPTRRHWRRHATWALTGTLVVVVAWAAALASAAHGSSQLRQVRALTDVFDYDVLRTSPRAAGPLRRDYDLVVIGDSRAAALGGTALAGPSPRDRACSRSADSLAAQLQQVLRSDDVRALNLACAGASVDQGLLQDQSVAGQRIPSQIGQLKRVDAPQVVVVSVGPNDVYWGPIVGSCYVTTCSVSALAPTVDSAMAAFSRSFDDLMAELASLEGSPYVVVVGAYAPFEEGASCDDTRLPDGSGSLGPDEITTMTGWRAQLNDILRRGAGAHDFRYVEPELAPLCADDPTGLGPDIWPLASENRFHPTPVGVLKTAMSVAAGIPADTFEQEAQADGTARGGPAMAVPAP